MGKYYFDTSALVKYYIDEKGTEWVKSILEEPQNRIIISKITGVEIISAFAMRKRMRDIDDKNYSDIKGSFKIKYEQDLAKIDVNDEIIKSGMLLAEIHSLRGYDATQLASALFINQGFILGNLPTLTFVSADTSLCNAAKAEGLLVENPNNYNKKGGTNFSSKLKTN